MLDPNAKRLREEYAGAIAALDAARSITARMLDAGLLIEQLETELLTEQRARRKVEAARRRMHEFESSEVAADRAGQKSEAA
jgi:hypothetical protein